MPENQAEEQRQAPLLEVQRLRRKHKKWFWVVVLAIAIIILAWLVC